jgi:hypothetical protein
MTDETTTTQAVDAYRPFNMGHVGFRIARLAHWLINDSGYTKRMAARELREIARQLLPPDEYEQVIGDAGRV